MQVRDVMTSAPFTIGPQILAFHARTEMSRRGIRHLLVTDGDRLVGIVTDRDIRNGVLAAAGRLSAWDLWEVDDQLARLTVEKAMSRDLVTIDPNRGLQEAARIMVERKIGALPVVSGE